MERLYALRGATQLHVDTPQEMEEKVGALMKELFEMNGLTSDSVVSIQFSVTQDLTGMNPATAFRRATGEGSIPLFCSQEPEIKGMPARTVRVLLHLYRDASLGAPRALYHGATTALRPDLSGS